MNKLLSNDSVTLTKGANNKVRKWYLKNVNSNSKLFIPSLNNLELLSVPYVKEEVRKR